MDHTIHMETIKVVLLIGVAVNLQVTNSQIMLIDTSLIVPGVLEETVPDLVTEVPEVVKV
jgi:hypothetical protein